MGFCVVLLLLEQLLWRSQWHSSARDFYQKMSASIINDLIHNSFSYSFGMWNFHLIGSMAYTIHINTNIILILCVGSVGNIKTRPLVSYITLNYIYLIKNSMALNVDIKVTYLQKLPKLLWCRLWHCQDSMDFSNSELSHVNKLHSNNPRNYSASLCSAKP